jgi:O-antigen/teichoic acid export membrane protein
LRSRTSNCPEQRPLLTSTAYAIAGHAFFHACQLGVLVLLAKFAGPEIQGQYILGVAIATPIVLLCGLELRGALVADAGNQFAFGTYRTLRNVTLATAGLVLAVVLFWIARAEHRPTYVLILAGVFAARIVWSWADIGWGTFQRRERLDLLAASVMLRGVALLLPFAVLLPICAWRAPGRLADATAGGALLCALGAAAALWLFDRPRVVRRSASQYAWDLSWTRPAVWALARQTFPLGMVALVVSLCDSYPRLLFDKLPNGKTQLGYFGALAYITLAGNLVILQAAAAAANRLSLYYQRDPRAFLRLGAWLTGLALGVGVVVLSVAWCCGGWILRALYTADYARFEPEFRIIVGAHCLALLTNVFGTATTQMRLFWVQVPVQVVTLAATVITANMLIIPASPVRGAAYTALVRAVVQLVLYTACVGAGLAWRRRRTPAV